MAEKQSELTPRKSINRYLCRCCNKFTASHDRPINLSGKKAKKERIRELILQFGHVKTIEGDGCGQIICTECYAKVTKIQKQVHSFCKVCMSTEAQKESRDGSKRCRRENSDCQENVVEQYGKRHRYRNILPQPEPQDQINATAKKRILPPGTFGQNKSVTRIMSHSEEILKNSGLNNPDVCIFFEWVRYKLISHEFQLFLTNNVALCFVQ